MKLEPNISRGIEWAMRQVESGYKIKRMGWFHEYIKLEFTPDTDHMSKGCMFVKTCITNYGSVSSLPWLASYEDIIADDWDYL